MQYTELLALLNDPGSQGVQLVLFADATVPAGQVEHVAAPGRLDVPAAQSRQIEEPGLAANLPAEQVWH